MKKRNLLSLLAFFLLIGLKNAEAQTIVNKEWEAFNGIPDSIAYSSSVLDGQGNLIVTSNAITTGQQANLLVMKYDRNGNLLWQDTYNGTFNGKDYGISVTTDNANNVYVAGASQTGAISSDYIIRKYSSLGTLQWNAAYSGSGTYNAPTAIATDNSGNVYVTGVTFSLSTQTDYATLKFNSSGVQQWAQTYNYANLYDVPAGIEVNASTGKIYVTGASASTNNNYDYATVEYDAANGNQLNVNRVTAPGTGFDKATAIERDNAGNIYITGQAFEQSTNSYDIKTIKLNSSLVVQWIQTYDKAGLEDLATTIDVDNQGNVYVGGYVSTADEGRNFITLKYDVGGNLIWDEEYNYHLVNGDDEVRKLEVNSQGAVMVVGTVDKGSETEFMMLKYDTNGNLRAQQMYDNGISDADEATDVKTDNNGNVYVTGKIFDGTNEVNGVVRYSIFDKSQTYELDANGDPYLIKNQLIVSLDTSAVIRATIDDSDIQWGSLDRFLKPATIAALQSKLPYDLSTRATVKKIFHFLNSTHTYTTTKTGQTIAIPPMWSTVKIIFSSPFQQGQEFALADSLETLSIVNFAHPEFVTSAMNNPADDTYYQSNQQISLYESFIPSGSTTPVYGINCEKAWDYNTGRSNIKVGIIDNGLLFYHDDFQDGSPMGAVKDGYDYETGDPLQSLQYPDLYEHGTRCAGIIGAVRDNALGVAGIAGGDDFYYGVSMYGLKTTTATSDMAAAIMEEDLTNTPLGYGVDIFNVSRKINETTEVAIKRKAVHFANRKGQVFVAARGNLVATGALGDEPIYPATTEDKWVLSVGAAGEDKTRLTQYYYGNGMDVLAPGLGSMIYTTTPDFNSPPAVGSTYVNSGNGSSFAAPHVAGVAALIKSYYDPTNNPYQITAPEDIEYVLENSASASNNYTSQNGYGLIDANAAIEMLVSPREIQHNGVTTDYANLPNNVSFNLISSQVPIFLTNDAYENETGQFFAGNTTYYADVYKLNATIQHNIGAKNIVDSWGLHSLSNTLPLYYYNSSTSQNELLPVEDVQILNVTNTEAELEGYMYKLYDLNQAYLGWIPASPYHINPSIRMHYSLYLDQTIGIEDELNAQLFQVVPNPSESQNSLKFNTDFQANCEIKLLDYTGRIIKTVFDGETQKGTNAITVDLAGLSQGIYFYQIQLNSKIQTIKFVKQ